MSIMINSAVSKQYLLTEDAVEGFKLAVENGQVRLALQVLTDVIDGIMEILDAAFEEVEGEEVDVQVEINSTHKEVIDIAAEKVEEVPVKEEKKEQVKKATQQKEKTETESAN